MRIYFTTRNNKEILSDDLRERDMSVVVIFNFVFFVQNLALNHIKDSALYLEIYLSFFRQLHVCGFLKSSCKNVWDNCHIGRRIDK